LVEDANVLGGDQRSPAPLQVRAGAMMRGRFPVQVTTPATALALPELRGSVVVDCSLLMASCRLLMASCRLLMAAGRSGHRRIIAQSRSRTFVQGDASF
jgi:hypothetical protein